MTIYITYDRYEHSSDFAVYRLCTDEDEARTHYPDDLNDFLAMGPDDCHQFQLEEVDMTKKEYKQLLELVDQVKNHKIEYIPEFNRVMRSIFEERGFTLESYAS